MNHILILNLFFFSFLFAQDSSSFRIGIKGGANFSHITGAEIRDGGNLNEHQRKFGFNFGIIADKNIDPMFAFQFEFLYNLTGSKWGQPLIPIAYEGDYVIYELQYLTLSVVGKLKSRIGDILKDFDFVIGAAYSYNISAKQKWFIESSGESERETGPYNIRPKINLHEFGIVYGIKFPIKNRKYYLSVLFYNALTSLYSVSINDYTYDFANKLEMKNKSLSICFDFFF